MKKRLIGLVAGLSIFASGIMLELFIRNMSDSIIELRSLESTLLSVGLLASGLITIGIVLMYNQFNKKEHEEIKTLNLAVFTAVGFSAVVGFGILFQWVIIPSLYPTGTISSTSPIINEYWANATKIENSSQASKIAGFDVKFPSKIPQNYTLQLAVMKTLDTDTKVAYLFYSKNPITDKMNLDQFLNQGFWVIYDKIQFDPNNKTALDNWISYSLSVDKGMGRDSQVLTINGYQAIEYDQHDKYIQGQKEHEASAVELFTENSRIILEGNLPKEELVHIAESIR